MDTMREQYNMKYEDMLAKSRDLMHLLDSLRVQSYQD